MLYAVTVSRLSVCMSSATYVIAAKNCLAYMESNGRVTGDVTWPNTLRAQYVKNSCRCCLATVCCEAVRSAVLATAWLLVIIFLEMIIIDYYTALTVPPGPKTPFCVLNDLKDE